MKKLPLFLISLIILFSVSCKKEVESINKEPEEIIENIIPDNNPTNLRLKRQTWSGPTTNGGGFTYHYNNKNQVIKIARHQWGTGSSNGGPTVRWDDTSYYYFEYNNGLCSKWTIDENGAKGYFTYEYNAQNLPVKRTTYGATNHIQSYSFYKYDLNGNLIEKKDSSYKVNFRYDFTYNSDNNLTSVTNNILWDTPQKKRKYEYLTHDDKVNFIRTVNGLPPTFIWDNNYHSYSSSSPNNFIGENHYWPVPVNQPYGPANFANYSYEYNEEGLPVKMRYTSWIVTFEYEKFR